MAKTDKEKVNKNWFAKIIIIQFIVCLALIAAFAAIVKSGGRAAESMREDYFKLMEKDYSVDDVSEAFNGVSRYIASFSEMKPSNTTDADKTENASESRSVVGGGVDMDFTSLDTLEGICFEETEIGFDLICPLDDYVITSGFGYRISPITGEPGVHTGVDMAANYGTAIKAAAGGTVVDAAYDASYGNYVKIRHKNNTVTIYAHCSSLCVVSDEIVKQGDVIAKVGSTGSSTGNHLHFEMRKDNIRIDPSYKLDLK